MYRQVVMRFVALFVAAAALFVGVETAAAMCAPGEAGAGTDCGVPRAERRFRAPPPREDSILEGVTYGWIEDYARFYEAPEVDAPWVRTASAGVFYGPVEEQATDEEGSEWLKVWGNWLPARYFHEVEASAFTGVEVLVQPERPFGWLLIEFEARPEPGAPAEAGARLLQRYDFVEIHDRAMGSDGAVWYDVGDGQWVRYHALALVTVREQPRDVQGNELWVAVDLGQQVFAAYEGRRMVFAGLISSGLPRWPTRLGLFRVGRTYLTTPMGGGEVGDDYYFLEDVPHTLFFDRDIALHGAYWHDDFGRPKSHGCVNIAPRAAEWLYYWAMAEEMDVWVWVHRAYGVEV